MCFRLLLASDGTGWDLAEVERWGAQAGLDVRGQVAANRIFVNLAWGDCACSLYTRREGRERLLNFIGRLSGDRIQLLLYCDGDLPDWATSDVAMFKWEHLRVQGLAGLPEGRVVELRLSGTTKALAKPAEPVE